MGTQTIMTSSFRRELRTVPGSDRPKMLRELRSKLGELRSKLAGARSELAQFKRLTRGFARHVTIDPYKVDLDVLGEKVVLRHLKKKKPARKAAHRANGARRKLAARKGRKGRILLDSVTGATAPAQAVKALQEFARTYSKFL